jgi:uncharacterized protein DUF1573
MLRVRQFMLGRSSCLLAVLLLALVIQVLFAVSGSSGGGRSEGGIAEGTSDASVRVVRTAPPLVGEGELVVKYDFPVVNETGREIRFTDVVSSCGCSKAKLATEQLAVGAETVLHVEVEMGHQGGERTVSCAVGTNTGQSWIYVLKATAHPRLGLGKPTCLVSFGELDPGEAAERTIAVYTHAAQGDEPPVLRTAEASSGDLELAWVEADTTTLPCGVTRRVTELKICLAPQFASGAFRSQVLLTYGEEAEPRTAEIQIASLIRSVYEVSPRRIHLGFVEEGKQIERTVHVRRLDGRPLEIRSANTRHSWIAGTVKGAGAADSAWVDLKIRTSGIAGAFSDEIIIETDLELQPEIRVPVSGICRSHVNAEFNGEEAPMK